MKYLPRSRRVLVIQQLFSSICLLVLCFGAFPAVAITQQSEDPSVITNNIILNPPILLQHALVWIAQLGSIGAVVFIAIYIVATVAFLPGSILTLGAGVVFGVWWGSLYVFIGATLGATAAFLVGRYLARGWVAQKLAGNHKFIAIDQAVGQAGLKIVLLTRLSPVFPFNLLNYAFGLTGVSLADYIWGSLGMIPGTVMYVYIGSLAGNLALIGTAARPTPAPLQWALWGVGLLATITVTVYVSRLAQQALKEAGLP